MRNLKLSCVLVVLLFGAATCLSGCRRGRDVVPPTTHPVNGKVVVAGGKIPAGYLIQFESDDPKCMAEALVEPDGTFKLVTRYEGVVCEGAVEDEYRVTIVAPMAPGAAFSGTKRLPKPIRIKPGVNDVTISFDAM